jgi:hypothetical protein
VTRTVWFDVPDPGVGFLNLNHRGHWRTKARGAKAWRSATRESAFAFAVSPFQRAHVTITFHKNNRLKYDVGNLMPTAKPVVDGLVDAGVFPDDDNRHITGPDLRPGDPVPRGATPYLTITVKEIAP